MIASGRVIAAIAALSVSSAAAASLTDQFSSFWVFGDSLSDDGNLAELTGQPAAPFVDGRFSNGPVWNEGITQEFSDNGQAAVEGNFGITGAPTVEFDGNFAFGGARADNDINANGPIPSLGAQIFEFSRLVDPASLGPDPLAAVWAGANDIFQDLPSGTSTQAAQDVGTDAAGAVLAGIGALTSLGFNNILSINLPDIGQTPRFSGNTFATDATVAFNSALSTGLSALDPSVNVFSVDAFNVFEDITGNPQNFGFETVDAACIFDANCLTADTEKQNDFLFFDDVHPTTAGHDIIAAQARDALAVAPVPLPAAMPLMMAGLGALVVMRRKRKSAI